MKVQVLLVVLFIGLSAFAKQSLYLHQPYLSTRVIGMGGAYTAVADDFLALYYNPAGLARLQEGQLNLSIQAGGTPAVLDFVNDLKAANGNAVTLQNVIAKNIGSHFASRVTWGGVWVRPGWGIGFHPLDLSIEADIRSSLGPAVGVEAYQDATIQFGLAWNFLAPEEEAETKPAVAEKKDEKKEEKKEEEIAPENMTEEQKKAAEKKAENEKIEKEALEKKAEVEKDANKPKEKVYRLSVGIAPKATYRAYIDKDLTLFDLQSNTSLFRSEDAQEGLTADFDIGALYTFKQAESGFFKWTQILKPTMGFAVRNVIDPGYATNFHLLDKNSGTTKEKVGRRFDVGVKLELPSLWVFHPRFAFDLRDLGHKYVNNKKAIHMGFELLWKAASWLHGGYRVGISQGYFTAGVSANLAIFMLDLATYSEEIGSSDSPRENRRFLARMSLDF